MSRIRLELEITVKTVGYDDIDQEDAPTQEEIDEIITQHQKELYGEIYNDLETTFGLDSIEEKEVIVNIKAKIVE